MASKRFKITDDELLSIVQARVQFEGSGTHRRPFERTALKNRLFYMGRQWHIEDRRSGYFREPKDLASNSVFYKANLAIGTVLRSILTVQAANGDFVVAPAKGDRRSEKAAWASSRLFEHMSYSTKLEFLKELACLMAALDGSCFWKLHWDPERGEQSRFYWQDGTGKRVLVDPDDRTKAEKEDAGHYDDVAQGDVRADVSSLFQSWWDWRARESGLQDAEWFAQIDLPTRTAARDEYGDMVDDLPSTQGREGSLYWNELLSFMSGQFGGATALSEPSTGREEDDRLLRVEMWEVPRASNGMQGRYGVVLGGKVVVNRDNKYRVTKHPIPFVRQDWITCPGRGWGISLMENLTGPQRQYNLARSKKIQHLRIFGQPMTFIPEEWGIPAHFVTVEPGALMRYPASKGGEIKYAPNVQHPKEVTEGTMEARAEIAEIGSQQSLDASKLPGQIRSAPGLELMMEERNKMLLHPAKNFLLAMEDVGRHMLDLAAHFYPDERIVHYVGEDQKYRALQIRKVDINTDLRVLMVKGEVLTSPAALRARVQELAALQVLDPANPEDKEALLRALEFRSANRLISDRLLEEENQEREVDEMIADPMGWIAPRADMMATADQLQGGGGVVQGYPTNDFDDDEIHARVLRRFARTQEFRDLPPEVQQLILLHLAEHEQKIEAKMMRQIEMQLALQGAPGEKGQPSKPKARQPSPMSA